MHLCIYQHGTPKHMLHCFITDMSSASATSPENGVNMSCPDDNETCREWKTCCWLLATKIFELLDPFLKKTGKRQTNLRLLVHFENLSDTCRKADSLIVAVISIFPVGLSLEVTSSEPEHSKWTCKICLQDCH